MNVNFEIAALFPSPYSQVKKGGNFKTKIHLDSVESFWNYLSSNILAVFDRFFLIFLIRTNHNLMAEGRHKIAFLIKIKENLCKYISVQLREKFEFYLCSIFAVFLWLLTLSKINYSNIDFITTLYS